MEKLPPLGGDAESVTISGFSSGSFMTHLLHVVHSKTIKGVGLTAGGPIHRDEIGLLKDLEAKGLIDPLSNLKGDPVYM